MIWLGIGFACLSIALSIYAIIRGRKPKFDASAAAWDSMGTNSYPARIDYIEIYDPKTHERIARLNTGGNDLKATWTKDGHLRIDEFNEQENASV